MFLKLREQFPDSYLFLLPEIVGENVAPPSRDDVLTLRCVCVCVCVCVRVCVGVVYETMKLCIILEND